MPVSPTDQLYSVPLLEEDIELSDSERALVSSVITTAEDVLERGSGLVLKTERIYEVEDRIIGPRIGEEILNAHVESGTITREQAELIKNVAPTVAKLVGETTDDNQSNNLTDYFMVVLHPNAAKAGSSRVPADLKQFIKAAKAIGSNGVPLLDTPNTRELLRPSLGAARELGILDRNFDSLDEVEKETYLASEEKQLGVKVDTSADILLALAIIDIVGYAEQFDEDSARQWSHRIAQYTGIDGASVNPHDGVAAFLIANVSLRSTAFLEAIQSVIDPHATTEIKERLITRGAELSGMTMAIIASAGVAELHTRRIINVVNRRHAQQRAELESSIDSWKIAASRLIESSLAQLKETPTPLSALSALAIEKWISEIGARVAEEVPEIKSQPSLALHEAIEKQVAEDQLKELAEVIQQLDLKIEEIGTRYEISNGKLRALNGLDLRRRLEEWAEPGSKRAVFMKPQAQQLAGLALLCQNDKDFAEAFAEDYIKLRQHWADLAYLRGGHSPSRNGLIHAVDTLLEWYEAAPSTTRTDRELGPLRRMAYLLDERRNRSVEEVSEQQQPETVNQAESDEPKDVSLTDLAKEFPKVEDIESFPPGTTEKVLVADLEKIVAEGRIGDSVELERITSLLKLRQMFEDAKFTVDTCRVRRTKTHNLPRFVLEVSNGDRKIAVVESPFYGRATYIVFEQMIDGVQWTWQDIIQFEYFEIRDEFGGQAKVHAAGATPADHRAKLFNAVITQF